jgi:DNA anti-recombination protein RmuC
MNWGRTEAQQRWFDEAERQEEERARCRRELKREEQRAREQHSIDQLRAEVQREIAALRSEMTQQGNLMLEAAGQALGEISNKILDRVEGTVNKLESDLRRQFGEAMGRIDAIAPDARRARSSSDYKFANERDEIIDMPSPLVRKVTMN